MKLVQICIMVLAMSVMVSAWMEPPKHPDPVPEENPFGIQFDDEDPRVKSLYIPEEDATILYHDLRPTVTPKEGDKPPRPQDTVKCHYRGYYNDNGKEQQFDSSYGRSPLRFGLSRVIKGWQYILQKMYCGQKWEVRIPSKLAYGKAGAENIIPPNTDLYFVIELIEVIPSSKSEL